MQKSSRGRLVGGGFFLLGAFVAVVAMACTPSVSRHFGGRKALLRTLAQAWFRVGDGDDTPIYGDIEAVEIPLVSPDGAFPDREERLQHPRWVFPEVTESQLARFINSCDLGAKERGVLLDRRYWAVSDGGCEISPPDQLVWSLNPRARAQIYSVLSRYTVNFPQCFPFRFPLSGFEAKLARSGLPAEEMALVRRLSYTNGDLVCFTDLQALRSTLRRPEFNDLVGMLYSVPTYLLRVRVTPDSDLEGMIHYWGRGGREKSIAPLLLSAAKTPGGATINVEYLLPTLARTRLYTYPYTLKNKLAAREDCFFTAMNFFNEMPDTNFFNVEYTTHALQTDYTAVKSHPRFGDLVTLANDEGEIFHACVYVARDYVFTKNGVDPQQPWVLMRMGDMAGLYHLVGRPGRVEFFRRKTLPAATEGTGVENIAREYPPDAIAGASRVTDQACLTFSQRLDFAE